MTSRLHPRSAATAAVPRRIAVLTLLVLAFTLLGAASALAITRDTVLARAQTWVDSPVPYSQARYHGGYRTDCSGYVSMCWGTGVSWSTRTFSAVGHRTSVAYLKPGDAMLKAGTHIRLFYGWVDAAHTTYVSYEQTGPHTKSSVRYMANDLANGYVPFRYNAIQDSPPSRNALLNGSFNVWSYGDPVWWPAGGSSSVTAMTQRTDLAKAGRFSLELDDPAADPSRFAEIEQTAAVSPEATYTLYAWARTAGDPHGVQVRLRYLDASGATLVDTTTTGDVWGVGNTRFTQMSLRAGAPTGTVTAAVELRVAGGVDASGTPGNSAVFDEISLVRPQAAIAIHADATTARSGGVPTLSGSVTPTSAVGAEIVVYVKKPGSSRWSYSSNRMVYASGDAAEWQYKYRFKPGMPKGVYTFRSEVPALAGYLGAMSPTTVGVRLR